MTKPVGVGSLFGKDAHSRFLEVTRQRYGVMESRLKKKGFPGVPFTLAEFRTDILNVMGGNEDGAITCRYCHRHLDIADSTADHAMPLSRGGGADLSNIDYPCVEDNQRKGSLTPPEYTALLAFLDTLHPHARQDVLARLQKANQLAAGMFRNQAIIESLKTNGEWGKALTAINQRKQQKKNKLDPF